MIDDYSRFPEVEIVHSTSALDRIFTDYGVPQFFKSENDPSLVVPLLRVKGEGGREFSKLDSAAISVCNCYKMSDHRQHSRYSPTLF